MLLKKPRPKIYISPNRNKGRRHMVYSFIGGSPLVQLNLSKEIYKNTSVKCFLQDFLMATDPVTFFIRIILPKASRPQKGISVDNGKTNERLLTRMEDAEFLAWDEVLMLISRYPQASTKEWIDENEKEVLEWFLIDDRKICLTKELKIVSI
jgi:hypothetical protein